MGGGRGRKGLGGVWGWRHGRVGWLLQAALPGCRQAVGRMCSLESRLGEGKALVCGGVCVVVVVCVCVCASSEYACVCVCLLACSNGGEMVNCRCVCLCLCIECVFVRVCVSGRDTVCVRVFWADVF